MLLQAIAFSMRDTGEGGTIVHRKGSLHHHCRRLATVPGLSQGTHGVVLSPLEIHERGVPPVLFSEPWAWLTRVSAFIMWRTFGGDVRPLRSAYPRRG